METIPPERHGRPKWPLLSENSPHLDNSSPHLHSRMNMGDRRQREKSIRCGKWFCFVVAAAVVVFKILFSPIMTPKMHSIPERVKQTLSPGFLVIPGGLNQNLPNIDQSSSGEESYMPIISQLLC